MAEEDEFFGLMFSRRAYFYVNRMFGLFSVFSINLQTRHRPLMLGRDGFFYYGRGDDKETISCSDYRRVAEIYRIENGFDISNREVLELVLEDIERSFESLSGRSKNGVL